MFVPSGTPSAHQDQFARGRLPPPELWPVMDYSAVPELAAYPARLNAAVELLESPKTQTGELQRFKLRQLK